MPLDLGKTVVLLLLASCPAYAQQGVSFSDPLSSGGAGPLMVAIDPGSFRMGCVSGFRCRYNQPVRSVSIKRPFALSAHEITRGQFRMFVQRTGYRTEAERAIQGEGVLGTRMNPKGGCWGFAHKDAGASENFGMNLAPRTWLRPGFPQSDDHPVVCVTWSDVSAYIRWLASETGRPYRLPTEAEWEYAARADTLTGDVDRSSLCAERYLLSAECNGYPHTVAVGQGKSNAFGLYDMERNVLEWVEDCWLPTLQGAPTNGSARTDGRCRVRTIRCCAWGKVWVPHEARSGHDVRLTFNQLGFRVAQSHSD